MGPTPGGNSGSAFAIKALVALALLSPLVVIAWPVAGPSAAPEATSVEEAFQLPLPPKPAATAAVGSSLLVAKMKDPAGPELGVLRDAPREELEGTLTGTLAEIEARLAVERRPRLSRAVRPRPTAAARRAALRGCARECRAERQACGRAASCRNEYLECVDACRP